MSANILGGGGSGAARDRVSSAPRDDLFTAAQNGDVELVRSLLDRGASVNKVDGDGRTALHLAAGKGHVEVVSALLAAKKGFRGALERVSLLSKNAFVNKLDNIGEAALHLAAGNGHAEVVRVLLNNGGASFKAVKGYRMKPLTSAAYVGHEGVLRVLIEDHSFKKTHANVLEALYWAAHMRQETAVTLLLAYYPDVFLSDDLDDKSKPLHIAAFNDNENIVIALLDAGAPVNQVDDDGETALHTAVRYSTEKVVKLLLDRGASVDKPDNDGKTALHIAARHSSEKVVKLLLDRGASVDKPDNYGNTALHIAVEERSGEEVVEVLLNAGASDDKPNKFGETALGKAEGRGNEIVKKLLKEHQNEKKRWSVLRATWVDAVMRGTTSKTTDSGAGVGVVAEVGVRAGAGVGFGAEEERGISQVPGTGPKPTVNNKILPGNVTLEKY